MVEQTVRVRNATGLHARPASLFVKAASQFASRIRLNKENKDVDAKSILGVLSLGAHKDSSLTIRCDGPDEQAAIEHLVNLINTQFGEA